jgi:hypothetical protein
MLAGIGILCLAGRSGHICGHICAEEQEGQLGVVHEDITGAGDLVDSIVTAQLPGIDRVCSHPLQ